MNDSDMCATLLMVSVMTANKGMVGVDFMIG